MAPEGKEDYENRSIKIVGRENEEAMQHIAMSRLGLHLDSKDA